MESYIGLCHVFVTANGSWRPFSGRHQYASRSDTVGQSRFPRRLGQMEATADWEMKAGASMTRRWPRQPCSSMKPRPCPPPSQTNDLTAAMPRHRKQVIKSRRASPRNFHCSLTLSFIEARKLPAWTFGLFITNLSCTHCVRQSRHVNI